MVNNPLDTMCAVHPELKAATKRLRSGRTSFVCAAGRDKFIHSSLARTDDKNRCMAAFRGSSGARKAQGFLDELRRCDGFVADARHRHHDPTSVTETIELVKVAGTTYSMVVVQTGGVALGFGFKSVEDAESFMADEDELRAYAWSYTVKKVALR